jgi:hypothetical protein
MAFILSTFVIHQFGFYSILINEPGLMETGTALNTYSTEFMSKYGNNFRTFKHGTLHGTMIGVFLILPIFVTNALFEKKKF